MVQLIKLSRRELFVSFSAIMSVIYTDVRERRTQRRLHSPQCHLNDFSLGPFGLVYNSSFVVARQLDF